MLSYGMIRSYAEEQVPEWQWQHIEGTVKNSAEEFVARVIKSSPDVVLATAYIFNLTHLIEVCALIKAQLPKVIIVLGGPSFLGDNQAFLDDNRQIHGVMRGDESSVPKLLKTIGKYLISKNSQNLFYSAAIPGLCRVDDNGVYHDNGTAEFCGDLDLLPSPFQTGLLAVDKPFCQLETSRGCNGSCQFCTSSESNGVKYFSLERCRADLLAIQTNGINEVRLIDRTFNDRPVRACALLEMFGESFPQMKFHLEINPAKLTPELLERLRQAPNGQLHIEIGVQTLNSQVLKRIKRPATVQATLKGLKELLAIERFELHADLIAGLPEQSIGDIITDVEQLMAIGPQEIQLENLKLLPGTTLRRELPVGYKFNQQPLWEVFETPTMTASELNYAMQLSYIIDSWYNAPQLHWCWCFAFKLIPEMLVKFCTFVANDITLQQGKLPLEKRFMLLEKFCNGKSNQAAELCRFSMVATGFVHPSFKQTVKTIQADAEQYQTIWSLAKIEHAKRYITMACSFNVGDFFTGQADVIVEGQYRYIFKLFYGRNVCEIVMTQSNFCSL